MSGVEQSQGQEQSTERALVGQMPYFSGLSEAELEAAALALSPVEVASGEVIFAQGQEGGWIYLLAQGSAEVSIELEPSGSSGSEDAGAAPGERRVLVEVSAPALLGEMSMLLDEPRSAWAVATGPCLLWQVSHEEVRHALEDNQTWAQRLLLAMSKILAARLAAMNRQLAALTVQQNGAARADLDQLHQSLYKSD